MIFSKLLLKISGRFIIAVLLTAFYVLSPVTGLGFEKQGDQLSPADIEKLYRESKQATPGEIEELIKLAEKGDIEAQRDLGLRYDMGLNVEKDSAKAIKWYKKAAKQGDVLVQYLLGDIYYNGEGVNQDYSEAAKWYRKAANQGIAEAQFKLAGIYATGEGVAEDPAEMLKWLIKAADQGHAGAQYNLGQFYKTEKNYTEAVLWYRRAAEQRFTLAYPMLGAMYLAGDGVAEDYVQAYLWFDLAANDPEGENKREVATILKMLSEIMTVQQMDEAKRLVLKWNAELGEVDAATGQSTSRQTMKQLAAAFASELCDSVECTYTSSEIGRSENTNPAPLIAFGPDLKTFGVWLPAHSSINVIHISSINVLKKVLKRYREKQFELGGIWAMSPEGKPKEACRAIELFRKRSSNRAATFYQPRTINVSSACLNAIKCNSDGVVMRGMEANEFLAYLLGVLREVTEGSRPPATVEEHRLRLKRYTTEKSPFWDLQDQ